MPEIQPPFGPAPFDPAPFDPAPFDPERYLVAAAPLLGLELDPSWIATVAANLRVLATAGELVNGFPLPDETEAAPRFEA